MLQSARLKGPKEAWEEDCREIIRLCLTISMSDRPAPMVILCLPWMDDARLMWLFPQIRALFVGVFLERTSHHLGFMLGPLLLETTGGHRILYVDNIRAPLNLLYRIRFLWVYQ